MTAPTLEANDLSRIYFSDFFEISPELLEEYGAFDVSLLNDLPLFIDPFLLFNSRKPEYRALHDGIIRYVTFLRDKSLSGKIDDGLLEAWFTFREVRQNWFGYSLSGNGGRGLGMDFARALNANLASILKNFGGEQITQGSHIEKVCLVTDGVGRDNISDFTTNLIKRHLLEFTQEFARRHLRTDQVQRIAVQKVEFSYSTETWETRVYELPCIDGRHVILTPVDLLTKDEVWINKVDMVRDYGAIADSVPNEQLRAQFNNYFQSTLGNIQRRDDQLKESRRSARSNRRRRRPRPQGPTDKQIAEAAWATIRQHPAFIDYYIRWKELHGDDAETLAGDHVRSSEQLYIEQVRLLVAELLHATEFYSIPGDTYAEAREKVAFLKDVIENKGGWRSFYVNGVPLRREADVRIMFRLTWCNTPSDVNQEVNNGRGPSDFEISRGRFDKSLVEFKLASNPSLERNLAVQAEIYQKASNAQHALKVILYFTGEERARVTAILRRLNLLNHRDVILINARGDDKQSASVARTADFE